MIGKITLIFALPLSITSTSVCADSDSFQAVRPTQALACDAAREGADRKATAYCRNDGGLKESRQGECKSARTCDSCTNYWAEVKITYFCNGAAGSPARPALSHDRYPSKPVRIIVPSAPGEAIDVLSRTLAPAFARRSGQPLTITNSPGARGMDSAANAPADGYTILISVNRTPMQPEGYTPVVLLARSASATENVFGLYVPGPTPKEVVAKLNAMVSAVLDTPDIAEKLSRQGLQPMGGTLEHLGRPTGAGTASQQQTRAGGSAKAAPAQSSSPTRTQSAATVAAVAAAPSADFDGFDAGLPYTEHYKYTCGTRPGEAMMPAESPNNCIAEQKRFMAIQCFPGWLMHETNIARFRCAADKSRGAPKAAWLEKLKGAQAFVRRNAPECNAETGCQGNTRLGNN